MAFQRYFYHPQMPVTICNFRERLALYLDQQHMYEQDLNAQKKSVNKLNQFIKDKELHKLQIIKEKKYIDKLHGNGIKDCLDMINYFIKELPKRD
jgi:hypothetical protein